MSDERRDDEAALLWARALETKAGRDYWRGVSDLLGTPAFRDAAAREFPDGADDPSGLGLSRRDFMRLFGASVALAGLGGCIQPPPEKIMPYTDPPSEVTPGLPLWFATSMVLDGYATGLLVRSNEGRPTKIEGNPEHPASLGATGVYEEASVLQLYDPQRARGVLGRGRPRSWHELLEVLRAAEGSRLRILMSPQSSPTMAGLLERLLDRKRGARVTFWSPVGRDRAYEGARLAFGAPLDPLVDLTRAAAILSLDADFLAGMPWSLRWSREFADRRRLASPWDAMNRLYVVEPSLTPTGSIADHRLRRRGSDVVAVAAAVLAELLAEGDATGRAAGAAAPPPALRPLVERLRARAGDPAWARAVARDLRQAQGAAAVFVGDAQPPEVHALGHGIAALAGAHGTTTALISPALVDPGEGHPLAALVDEMRAGVVDTLVILDANPVYAAPADLDFAGALARVANPVHFDLYVNETSARCAWFAPITHYLEMWGDARAYDGTVSLQQPLIAPLHDGRTPAEIIAAIAGDVAPRARELLRRQWGGRLDDEAIRRGLLPDTGSAPAAQLQLRWDAILPALERAAARDPGDALELHLAPSPTVHDGRFANVSWLQELPGPMTKLTWGNAALVSPRRALDLGVKDGDVVELAVDGRRVHAPVLVLPGQADGSVTLHLGHGRDGTEQVARGVGVNAYVLRSRADQAYALGLEVHRTGARQPLPVTQEHWAIEGRPIVFATTLARYRTNPEFTKGQRGPVPSLLPEYPPVAGHEQWAMSIDMTVCTGCSSCVVACQAENNVPVVGREGVLRSREMHWLRIDRYYLGTVDDPQVVNQPMLCQHCEKAPCEYVCPVNATVHSPDGLNEMVYNRCVGTRFCSNNCPYKVRRFNYFDYVDRSRRLLQRNPEVTVRERGVMEKCTYCVQRIRNTEIQARVEGREIRPGEVRTACQQACPTRAISFGSLRHRDTDVVRWREQPRAYGVLHDQGTQPRNQYLAKITNPNPEIE